MLSSSAAVAPSFWQRRQISVHPSNAKTSSAPAAFFNILLLQTEKMLFGNVSSGEIHSVSWKIVSGLGWMKMATLPAIGSQPATHAKSSSPLGSNFSASHHQIHRKFHRIPPKFHRSTVPGPQRRICVYGSHTWPKSDQTKKCRIVMMGRSTKSYKHLSTLHAASNFTAFRFSRSANLCLSTAVCRSISASRRCLHHGFCGFSFWPSRKTISKNAQFQMHLSSCSPCARFCCSSCWFCSTQSRSCCFWSDKALWSSSCVTTNGHQNSLSQYKAAMVTVRRRWWRACGRFWLAHRFTLPTLVKHVLEIVRKYFHE